MTKLIFVLKMDGSEIDRETIYVNSDGKPSFSYIRYATNLNGYDMQASPDDTHIYIGVYTGILATAPNIASAYTWMKWKGDTGKGTKGDNGYVHIAWCNTSDNSDGSFTISNTDGKEYAYIGTYTDNTKSDSQTFATYTWVKVKGASGKSIQNIYIASVDKPSNPTFSTSSGLPSSTDALPKWSVTPYVRDYGIDISYTDMTYAVNTEGTITQAAFFCNSSGYIQSPSVNNSGYACCKLTIKTTIPNSIVYLEMNASSESGYDFGIISALDDSYTTSPRNITSYIAKISGTQTFTKYLQIASAGTHTVYVYYTKDGSGTANSDCITFRTLVPKYYFSTAQATKDESTAVYTYGTWSDVMEHQFAGELIPNVSYDHNKYKPTSYNNENGTATSDIDDSQTLKLMAGSHECHISSVSIDNMSNVSYSYTSANSVLFNYHVSQGAIASNQLYKITMTGYYNGTKYSSVLSYEVSVPLKGEQGSTGKQGSYLRKHEKGFEAISYYAGNTLVDGQYPLDIVFVADSNVSSGYRIYQCITDVTYTTAPTSADSNWSKISINVQSAYFNWIIARDAVLDFIATQKVIFRDSNGYICASINQDGVGEYKTYYPTQKDNISNAQPRIVIDGIGDNSKYITYYSDNNKILWRMGTNGYEENFVWDDYNFYSGLSSMYSGGVLPSSQITSKATQVYIFSCKNSKADYYAYNGWVYGYSYGKITPDEYDTSVSVVSESTYMTQKRLLGPDGTYKYYYDFYVVKKVGNYFFATYMQTGKQGESFPVFN